MLAQRPVNCEVGRLPSSSGEKPGNHKDDTSGEKAGNHKDTQMRNILGLINCDRKIAPVERIQTNAGNHKNTDMRKDKAHTRPEDRH